MGDDRTRRQVLRYGGLAAGATVSGCLRLTESAQEGTENAAGDVGGTTANAATATTVSGDGSLPPGVSPDGVSGDLVQAHKERLADERFTVDAQFAGEQRTVRIKPGAALFESNIWADAYVTDEETLQRFTRGETTVYGRRDTRHQAHFRSRLSGAAFLNGVVRGLDLRPTGTETVDGESHVRLESVGVADASTIGQDLAPVQQAFSETVREASDATATLLTRPDGLVRRLHLTVQHDGSREFTVETTSIGSTEVREPEWSEAARTQALAFDIKASDDRQFLVLEQVDGGTVPAKAAVAFHLGVGDTQFGRNDFVTSFSGTTSPGKTYYLYKTQDEGDNIIQQRLGVSERPDTDPYSGWDLPVEVDFRIGGLRLFDRREVAR